MSCGCSILNGGITKGCENNLGGIRAIYITDKCNVLSYTLSSPDDTISAINMTSGTVFYEFQFNKNSSTFTEVLSGDQANGVQVVTQTITLKLSRREKSKRDTLALLAGFKELVVIVLDANGIYWLFGEENGVVLTENNSETGTASTDFNGYTLTMVGEEPEFANEVEAAAVAAAI